MSRTIPVRIGVSDADETKLAPVFNSVMKARKSPITSRVVAGSSVSMSSLT